tara:strand:+ start:24 stop:212 length:189 start_codon:yes stop_codon:yes gene_type:complete
MSNTLTDGEMVELVELGEAIRLDLSCDANGTGLPCRTDRLEAVKNMVRYLEIHDFKIVLEVK